MDHISVHVWVALAGDVGQKGYAEQGSLVRDVSEVARGPDAVRLLQMDMSELGFCVNLMLLGYAERVGSFV